MKTFLAATSVLALIPLAGFAQTGNGAIKIGVLNDQSSSFSALGGTEVVEAVR